MLDRTIERNRVLEFAKTMARSRADLNEPNGFFFQFFLFNYINKLKFLVPKDSRLRMCKREQI